MVETLHVVVRIDLAAIARVRVVRQFDHGRDPLRVAGSATATEADDSVRLDDVQHGIRRHYLKERQGG